MRTHKEPESERLKGPARPMQEQPPYRHRCTDKNPLDQGIETVDFVRMKNITVSVDDKVYHRARVRAAEQKTSVSAIVRRLLEEVSQEKTEFERLKDLEERTLRGMKGAKFSASNRMDRASLHDRDALR